MSDWATIATRLKQEWFVGLVAVGSFLLLVLAAALFYGHSAVITCKVCLPGVDHELIMSCSETEYERFRWFFGSEQLAQVVWRLCSQAGRG